MISSPPSSPSPFDARRRDLGLTMFDLWVRCLSIGGNFSRPRFRALILGEEVWRSGEWSVVEQALDEAAMDACVAD